MPCDCLLDAPGSTLLGLPRLLTDDGYRKRLLAHSRDPVVRNFWQSEFAEYSERFAIEAIAPIQNKVGTLLSPPAIRNMLGPGQKHDRHSRASWIAARSSSSISPRASSARHRRICSARSWPPPSRKRPKPAPMCRKHERTDFTLYADEFQHFATDSFATILSEARKYHLALVLAHQFVGQLPPLLRQAVIGNAGSIVAFRIGAEDAPLIANELGIDNQLTLTDTSNFSAWVKLVRNGVPSEARAINTLPPDATNIGQLQAVRNRTHARYARPRAVVEKRINAFIQAF